MLTLIFIKTDVVACFPKLKLNRRWGKARHTQHRVSEWVSPHSRYIFPLNFSSFFYNSLCFPTIFFIFLQIHNIKTNLIVWLQYSSWKEERPRQNWRELIPSKFHSLLIQPWIVCFCYNLMLSEIIGKAKVYEFPDLRSEIFVWYGDHFKCVHFTILWFFILFILLWISDLLWTRREQPPRIGNPWARGRQWKTLTCQRGLQVLSTLIPFFLQL